jgi:hypothetical protein
MHTLHRPETQRGIDSKEAMLRALSNRAPLLERSSISLRDCRA